MRFSWVRQSKCLYRAGTDYLHSYLPYLTDLMTIKPLCNVYTYTLSSCVYTCKLCYASTHVRHIMYTCTSSYYIHMYTAICIHVRFSLCIHI